MAVSNSTLSFASGAVDSLFAGLSAGAKGKLQADGLRITAEGTRIGAESTRLNASSLRIKAQGDLAEADNYDLAADLALKNQQYTATSTRVQQAQSDRAIYQAIGGQRAQVAGAGFASSGTALDLMRDSASQGALARGVLGQQGAITEAGFKEQQDSYKTMSAAARMTAAGEFDIADKTDVVAGRQDEIAGRQDQLARDTQSVADQQGTFDFISAGIKSAAAVASYFV